jgi:arylsulfatase
MLLNVTGTTNIAAARPSNPALETPRKPLGGTRLALLLGCVALCFGAWTADAALTGARPDIILILTDDQGYGDLSCHGNPILKTPNLDRLHDEGVRFADFHVSPTCAPTRSALLSGKHEFKNGVTHTIFERERMSLKTTTLAQVLKSAGYATGIFGKWHLGDEPEYQPGRRGFDEVFIHGGGGIGQTYPGSCGDAPGNTYFDPAILHNGSFVKTRGFCSDVFTAQALRWIESAKGRQPFFCYLAFNAPHSPLSCPPRFKAPYTNRVPDNVATFFGMIANIDENVGWLLAKLEEWKLATNTLVIFMNDNGGTAGGRIWNAGLRGLKATPWQGGTRAASFWRWPGTLKPADVGRLTAHVDVFPTLAELAGAKVSAEVTGSLDGRSLVPLLQDPQAPWPDRYLVTHVGRWARGRAAESKYSHCSIRNSRYSLVCDAKRGAGQWELFDLKADYGETHNLAAQNPGVVQKLETAYDQWWASVQPLLVNENAVGPKLNPFKALYWQQFGGGPTPEELRAMDPSGADSAPASNRKQQKRIANALNRKESPKP